jgi:4,5-dihydroxyphthalate decarboxylase
MTTAEIEFLINDKELAGAALAALESHASVSGVTASPLRPVHNGFKPFVGGQSYEVSEIAIVTMLQAVAHDRPVLFLPLTALGRHQHQTLISTQQLSVDELPGRTVGVRAWSQTTGMWVRGFLAHQYNVDLRSVRWRTYEGGHIPEQDEPSWVERAQDGASLAKDLLEGRVDFAVMGNDRPDDARVRSVIADPASASAEWAQRVGYVPVNHVFAVRESAARELGDAVCGMYDAVAERLEARKEATTGVPLEPYGFAALRPAVTAAAQYAWEQELLPRPVDYDELVARTCAALGVPASRLGG